MAIEYFDRAKCWEKSIELVKELQSVYEEEADYKSLAKLVVLSFVMHFIVVTCTISAKKHN
jgi:hypothetical protein